ncbi:MAG: hypothetical protein JXB88_05025 [Spirochaetales bacterium]|nr:hypothetical protein [Spirochaetales bacterium]
MKKDILILLMLLLTAFLSAQTSLPPRPDLTLTMLSDLDIYFPRYEGSGAEKQVIRYIENTLSYLNLPYSKDDFSSSNSFHSFSESIRVTIHGKEKDSIIFLIPLNHPLDAEKETDGLINIALGLTLITHYSSRKPPVTLQFVFLGAEYGDSSLYPLGSTLYLDDFCPDYPVMLLYFSFQNIPKRIIVGGAGQGRIAPYWFTIRCSEALKKADVPFLISGNKNQIFRLGLAEGKTSIEPFLKARYPSLSLSGMASRLSLSEKKNWIFSFCSFIDILINKSSQGIPEYWDQHYLFFQLYDFYLIIQENIILIVFIVISGIAIIFTLIYYSKIKSNIINVIRYTWVAPLIFAVAFLLLFFSTLIIQGILQLRQDFSFWEAYPFLFLILKGAIALLLFIFCLKLFRFIRLPMKRNFYATLTIILLLINIFFIALINISFVYYYLWAFCFIFLAFLFKNRIIRLILILPGPYWIIKLVLDFFIFIPEPIFCRIVLFSLLKGNILISLLLLPFITLAITVFLSFFPARHKRSRVQYNATTLFFIVVNLVLILTLLFIPHFSENRPQEVTVRNVIDFEDLTNQIVIDSSSPLGDVTLWNEQVVFNFETTSRKYILQKKYIPDLLAIDMVHTSFFDRNNVIITIRPEGTPNKIFLKVHADKEFTLYDSNFPFKKTGNGEDYEILIGAFPPSPLKITLTIPQDLSCVFSIQVDYVNIPFLLKASGKNKQIKTILTLKKQVSLGE